MLPSFALRETLRFTPRAGFPAGFARLDAHLDRLAASAAHFGFASPTTAAIAALREEAMASAGEPQRRCVRVVADPNGRVTASSALLPADASRVHTAALARTPVDRDDVVLHHNTTHRALYDARRAECRHADDVLLWNVEGELVGFTTGALVVEIGGRRWTPPRACGARGGVFRGELLARALIAERVLRPPDLAGARTWLVSSLREWVAVTMLDGL